MKNFEIYWDDLTQEAKDRHKELYHDNIELTPIAIVELEEEIDNFYKKRICQKEN
jgi:hypothetical protein